MSLVSLKCPNCNGDINLDDSQEIGYCMYCGSKVSLKDPTLSLNINVTGKVSVEGVPSVDNLRLRAEEFSKQGDEEMATQYYNKILDIDPEDQEARLKVQSAQFKLGGYKLDWQNIRKIHTYVASGQKIAAIKEFRELTGADLKTSKDIIDELVVDPRLVDPESIKQEGKKGACYIATAVYGSYDAPEVLLFRSFRDRVMLRSWWGKPLVRIYYFCSPPLAKRLKNMPRINGLVRRGLDRWAEKLKNS